MGIEIANLIVGILSLLATIGISISIFYLENKNAKRQEKHTVSESARRFIIENADERGYLPWAVIAAGCFPQNKHCRRIYNEFSILDERVKLEVLKQTNLNIPLIRGDDWIADRLKVVQEAADELSLGDTFLYDGAKYFHRLYDQKERDYSEDDIGWHEPCFKDVFGLPPLTLSPKKGYLWFRLYMDSYLYFRFQQPDRFSEKWEKPFDYLLVAKGIQETPDEGYVCCWVSHIIEETIVAAVNYLSYSEKGRVSTDSYPETYEDRYFQVLYRLFFFEHASVDDESKMDSMR